MAAVTSYSCIKQKPLQIQEMLDFINKAHANPQAEPIYEAGQPGSCPGCQPMTSTKTSLE